MKTYFLDSSALVRLYVHEPGSTAVRDLVRAASAHPPRAQLCTCDLALPETISALRQVAVSSTAARRGFSPAAYRRALPVVRSQLLDPQATLRIGSTACIPLAADIVERRDIRGADAVHLAAALTARETLMAGIPFVFVSGDARQCRAAEQEGFQVLEV